MYKYGLKLWSTNENYLAEASRLLRTGVCDYIELYVIPESFRDNIGHWRSLKAEYVIHAPHFMDGVNLAKPECQERNRELGKEAFDFADALAAETVIFHPGIGGTEAETVRQLKMLADPRIVVENKPYLIPGDLVCNGYSTEQLEFIMNEAGVGLCLDIGHACCAANALKRDKIDYLKQFIALNPRLYHLTDGNWDSPYDEHYHLGQGNYSIAAIMRLLSNNSRITIETEKDLSDSLKDYEADIARLKAIDTASREGVLTLS